MRGRSVALIWACVLLTAPIGQPADSTISPNSTEATPEEHTNMEDAPAITPQVDAPAITPMEDAPAITPEVDAPAITPMEDAPAITPEVDAPAITPMEDAPAITPEVDAPAITPMEDAPAITPEVDAPAITPMEDAPAITHEVDAPAITPMEDAPAITHEVDAPAITPMEDAPAITHEVDAPAITPMEDAPAITPEVDAPAITPMEDAPAITHEVDAPAITHEVDAPAITPEVDAPAITPEVDAPAITPMEDAPAITHEPHVRHSHALCAAELDFVLRRKEVVLNALSRLGVKCTLDSVPHVAVLGSSGGQRAAVALMGSLSQMKEEGLLDAVLYLASISGSAWSMASLYSDPEWSTNMDAAVSKLSGPEVDVDEALKVLLEMLEDKHFSLSDIWGIIISVDIMKQLDRRYLSEDAKSPINPYPIYPVLNKNCIYGPEKGKWFELAPLESGFTDLGLFVNTSLLGRTGVNAHGPQIDMIRLQGISGSALADERALIYFVPDPLRDTAGIAAANENNVLDLILLWMQAPQEIKTVWDVLDVYIRCYQTVLKVTGLIRENTDDPAALSELEEVQRTLREGFSPGNVESFVKISPEKKQKIFQKWGDQILKPMKTWSQNLEEGPTKDHVSWLVHTILPLIVRWEWGTTTNFLHEYSGAGVPSCISSNEHIHLIDAGSALLLPLPPFLGEKRDTDLLIALEFSAEVTFKSLIHSRDYAAKVKKPFPHIDEKLLEDKDWPKDCYVFQGKEKEPTIIYMPLFNRKNCKDAQEIKAKMEEFATVQGPFSQEKIDALLEIAKDNVKNNKKTLLREINKAVLRRQKRSVGRSSEEADL